MAIVLWLFWLGFSLATPVTIFDANTYNLARLPLAWKGGLFGNPFWNTDRQVCLPWTFDSIHLPFLLAGFGASLPSFACFTGLLIITFRLVSARFGKSAGWWCCSGLLALPTLIYQATSCKNDLAVVFAAAAWYYALDLFRRNEKRLYLVFMALSLSFAAGSKTSGVPIMVILSLYSFWTLRRSPRICITFLSALIPCLILWGSTEIYANNLQIYGHLLGADTLVRSFSNHDGIRGSLANLIRYAFGNINAAVDALNPHSRLIPWLEQACRQVLQALGLRNRGYSSGFDDTSLRFLKDGWEASSDFGPLGGIALWFTLVALVGRRSRDLIWKLSALSTGSLLLVCSSIGWMPWNNRFLMIPFALATIALVLAVIQLQRAFASAALFALIGFSALVIPCFSLNKNPAGFYASIMHRRTFTFLERPTMKEVVNDISARVQSGEVNGIALCAGGDSWILPFFSISGLTVAPVPKTDEVADPKKNGRQRYVLILNQRLPVSSLAHLRLIRTYSEADSALYQLKD